MLRPYAVSASSGPMRSESIDAHDIQPSHRYCSMLSIAIFMDVRSVAIVRVTIPSITPRRKFCTYTRRWVSRRLITRVSRRTTRTFASSIRTNRPHRDDPLRIFNARKCVDCRCGKSTVQTVRKRSESETEVVGTRTGEAVGENGASSSGVRSLPPDQSICERCVCCCTSGKLEYLLPIQAHRSDAALARHWLIQFHM